ncbi:ABC transporter permease [Ramlibacter sp.]|uniref:ABC transporter permease n=1 Tax=Ramlibacter sp. TaxID=1917967 RepID=UPI002FC71C06
MLAYIIRRLVATIPVMGLVALFVFSLLYLSPGDPASIIAGDLATEADILVIRQKLGLDQPFLVRFGGWLWAVLHGDLGTSIFSNHPVLELVKQRIEPTIALTISTMLMTVVIAIPMGVVAAWKAGSWIDGCVMAFGVGGFSVPIFVIGYGLILVFSIGFGWLPVQGYRSFHDGIGPFLRHLVLPSLALTITFVALVARITRAAMLDVLGQDYIRTAKAKGLNQRDVLVGHALKNAAVPIATIIGIGVALLIGGVVVTETVFAIPGMGRLVVDAILRRDYPVIQGLILLFSAAYVLVNLAVDISYTFFDPRVRY